ncbi:MAG: helix-turn-helix domain-containing protein [Maricaulaceae bacterium]|nr:helix-turn-helix domain-containing protein [Maricaulaceae bacterium]
MPAAAFKSVRALALFHDMADANFDRLTKAAYLQRFPAHVQLIEEGGAADFLHVVVEGCVELFASHNGRDTTMALVHPVSTFILAATLKDRPYLMSARTTMPGQILMIPSADIRTMLEIDPGFARAMVVELASCYRNVVKELKNQKLRTSVERVANYLIRQQKRHPGMEFALPVEKRALASLLGMTPENLSRAFGALRSHGVEVDGPMVRLTDIEALSAMARPNPLIDDFSS